MSKARTMLVGDLKEGDKIRIPSPECRVVKITPLKRRYNTKMRGKILEVESVDLLWKGQKTILLLSDEDKVSVGPRPNWLERMKEKWGTAKKNVKPTKPGWHKHPLIYVSGASSP